MADEVIEEKTEPVVAPETKEEPHPLEEGGVRFNQVYAQLQEQKRQNQEARERLARLEGEAAARQAQPKQAEPVKLYTAEELQQLVDAGRLAPMQAADRLAAQRAYVAQQESNQQRAIQERAGGATAEINEYIRKMPGLIDQSTPEYRKVAQAAYDISNDLGIPVTDPRVQRRALREAFGTLDSIAETRKSREFDRRGADTHQESGRGVGGDSGKPDPLKNVDKAQLAYWDRLGYTEEQKLEEAKYYRPRRIGRG